MTKKLMLITPPYHAGVVESAGSWPHLGFVYIAGHARDAGYEVEIYDAMTKDHDLDEIRDRIEKSQPDYVASTAYTSSINAALDVLKLAKDIDSDIITLIGGIHANFHYEELVADNPEVVNFAVRGEGELTIPELLDTYENDGDLEEVKGIAFLKSDEVVVTPPRPFIEDLDTLIPAWDLLDWDDYTFYVMPGSTLGIVNSSRGCDQECSFCSQRKFWKETYRERSAEDLVKELEYLRDEFGVDVVMLSDEYPTRNQERWNKILDLLIERETGVDLLLETCVEDILRDADIMDKYREAGILHIYVGVEATNQETLDSFKKDLACEESKEAIRLINEAGMITECSFVLGLPGDTPESIAETLELAKHYNPDFAHFLHIAPWPYADMYDELKDNIITYDYADYNFIKPVVKPDNMTEEEIEQALVDCYREFYMDKVKEFDDYEDDFKRDYMWRSMQVMMQNSFLTKYLGGMGDIPDQVKKYLKKIKS